MRKIELPDKFDKLSSYAILAWADILGARVNEGLGYQPQVCGFLRAIAIAMQKTDPHYTPAICVNCDDKGWYRTPGRNGGTICKWCSCDKGVRKYEERMAKKEEEDGNS